MFLNNLFTFLTAVCLHFVSENEFLFVSPNRYVFPGAEVFDKEDESDCSSNNSDSDTDSDDEASDEENNPNTSKTENNDESEETEKKISENDKKSEDLTKNDV